MPPACWIKEGRDTERGRPALASAHSSLLIALCLDPQVTAAQLLVESRRWEERHARVEALGPAPEHDRDPGRPLRERLWGSALCDGARYSAVVTRTRRMAL